MSTIYTPGGEDGGKEGGEKERIFYHNADGTFSFCFVLVENLQTEATSIKNKHCEFENHRTRFSIHVVLF